MFQNIYNPYFNFNVSRFLVYCMVTLLEVQLTRNAVVILDTAATKFFLKDFNLRTRSLWVSLYWNLVSLYFYKLFIDSFVMQPHNKLETVQWKKPRNWNVIKNLSKSQVFVAHSFWVTCRNVSCTFGELCMEMPYWCTVLVHQYGRRKSTKTSRVHFFYKSSFFSLGN